MDKLSYVDFIDLYQSENTIKLIGKIDKNILKEHRIETLYYIFPLIERIVLEIYKLIPEADVEHLEQGIMKTPKGIIEANETINVLPDYIKKLIYKYFGDESLRNKLFHMKKVKFKVKVAFIEIDFLLMKLLKILNKKLEEYEKYEIKEISLL